MKPLVWALSIPKLTQTKITITSLKEAVKRITEDLFAHNVFKVLLVILNFNA